MINGTTMILTKNSHSFLADVTGPQLGAAMIAIFVAMAVIATCAFVGIERTRARTAKLLDEQTALHKARNRMQVKP